MSRRRKGDGAWPFERKFALWLSDHGLTLNAFARRHGFPQQTLHGWVKLGRRIPGEAIALIAAVTKLPADYWLSECLPYPAPLEYASLTEDALAALKGLPLEQLSEVLAMLRDPEDLKRTLALRRAARGDEP